MSPEAAGGQQESSEAGRLAKEHYENFPVGSFLLPRRLRPHVHRIYAFARVADDLVDEDQDREGLLAWRSALDRALAGETSQAPKLLVELAATQRDFALDPQLFYDLLDAFERDLDQNRYENLKELHSYCEKSANPIGRLMLGLFRRHEPELLSQSDQICTALQILNHLQDIRSDYLERNRIYLPGDRMRALGVEESELGAASASPALRRLVLELAAGCEAGFREGWPLAKSLGGRFGLELSGILHGAFRVLQRLNAADGDVLARRPKLRRRDALPLLWRTLFHASPPRISSLR